MWAADSVAVVVKGRPVWGSSECRKVFVLGTVLSVRMTPPVYCPWTWAGRWEPEQDWALTTFPLCGDRDRTACQNYPLRPEPRKAEQPNPNSPLMSRRWGLLRPTSSSPILPPPTASRGHLIRKPVDSPTTVCSVTPAASVSWSMCLSTLPSGCETHRRKCLLCGRKMAQFGFPNLFWILGTREYLMSTVTNV